MIKKLKNFIFSIMPGGIFIQRGKTESSKIALTFDDGPNEEITVAILAVLKEYGIKATFFIIGSKAEQNKEILKRIYDEGHEIGSHGFLHQSFKDYRLSKMLWEIKASQVIIKEITGSKPILFRAPYGYLGINLFLVLFLARMKYVHWSIDPEDFIVQNPEDIITNCLKYVLQGGDIILMHDKHYSTVKALPGLIERIKDKGFGFGKVSEII